MFEDIDTDYQPEIVCPSCGYVFSDSWEYEKNCEYFIVECEDCGARISVTRNTEVTYSSRFLPTYPDTEKS